LSRPGAEYQPLFLEKTMAQRILMNQEQMNFAKNIPLFSGLSTQEKDTILKSGGIYSYGDKYIYIVCSGIVQECRQTSDGRELTVNIYSVGDVFCKTSAFATDAVHTTNAITVGEADILELPIGLFKESLLKYAALTRQFFADLAQFAHQKQIEVEQQATMTATEIVACFLRKTCSVYGLDPNGFKLPFKKSLIASRLGMELETLSRTLPKLQEHGIFVKGSHVNFVRAKTEADNKAGANNIVRFPAAVKAVKHPLYAAI
jgi:CRP-like cAMP-binding protein